MTKITTPKLSIELIPSTCFFSNVRSMVSSKDWNKIRGISYMNADNKCEICGSTGKKQGYNHNVQCHEVFEYYDKLCVQKLVKLVSLCVVCHLVKHIGRSIKVGKKDECFAQLAKVNKWNQQQINEHIETSFEVYKERSQFEWSLDLTILNDEPYNLKINLNAKRKFAINKYKKKRKRKPKKIINKRPKKKII